jgi:hypothetical protein
MLTNNKFHKGPTKDYLSLKGKEIDFLEIFNIEPILEEIEEQRKRESFSY